MPKNKTCDGTFAPLDADPLTCVHPDPWHLGNHRAEDGHEWFNERDQLRIPGEPPARD